MMFNMGLSGSFLLLLSSLMFSLITPSIWEVWAMMEFNLLAFIYWAYFILDSQPKVSSFTLVYFLVQASSSLGIFWLVLLELNSTGILSLLSWLFLFVKLGMFPFHYWVISISKYAPRLLFTVLMVPQKIIPFMFLRMTGLILLILILNVLASLWLSFSELGIYKMIIYSSMFNMSWLMTSYGSSWETTIIYFLVYGLATSLLLFSLPSSEKSEYLSWDSAMSLGHKLMILMCALSLAGFPPTIGFYAKMMISATIMKVSPLLLFVLVSASTLLTYLYLRLFFPYLVGTSFQNISLSQNSSKVGVFVSVSLLSPWLYMWSSLLCVKKDLSF